MHNNDNNDNDDNNKSKLCVLRLAVRWQDHSKVERYRAGYLYRSTTAEKPDVTVVKLSKIQQI